MNKERLAAAIHYNAAFIGGCLGIYAITMRFSFGSAETMNLLSLVADLLGRNMHDFIVRLGALILYSAGIVSSELIIERKEKMRSIISFSVDAIAVIVLFFIPADVENMIALYPIFLASAMQWCLIKGPYGYVSASIFSTNNLKQFLIGAVRKAEGKETNKVSRMHAYGVTLLSFHAGACYEYFAVRMLDLRGIAFVLIPLFMAFCLSLLELKKIKENC